LIWDNLSSAWRTCFEEAWTAYRSGSAPIGACISDQTETVLAKGHNRIAQKNLEMPFLNASKLAHAEINAMLHLASKMQNEPDFQGLEVRDLILWTTTEPCPLCVGGMVMMNFRELKYASKERWAGSLEIFDVNRYVRSKKMKIHHPENKLLETILVMLHVEFELRDGDDGSKLLIECWEQDTSEAIHFGTILHQNGTLNQVRNDVSDARIAMNTLEEYL
jgi:tRNA(adenine34) deaminase